MPSTSKGTAKVQPSRGVKINYLYYWSTDDSFLRPEIEGTNVPIRYDPFDVGTAYAYVKDHWVRCISEYYKSFQSRSEREVNIASTQLRRKRQKHAQKVILSAKEKATYLEGIEAQEALLIQRLHDLAHQDVCALIEGKLTQENSQNFLKSLEKNNGELSEDNQPVKVLVTKSIDFNEIEAYSRSELW